MGIILLVFSGLCQGSFGLGYKKYDPLSWEAFWGVYSLFCAFDAFIWTLIAENGVFGILGTAAPSAIWIPVACGFVWGLSTLAFSKSVLLCGMSLCFGVNMGVSSVVGTLVPFFTGNSRPETKSIVLLIISIVISLIGIAVITWAGLKKEKLSENQSEVNSKSGATAMGIILAIVSGLCSGVMNVGFDKAAPLGAKAENFVGAAAIQWLPVLLAGMAASIIACLLLAIKNKTLNSFGEKGVGKTLLKLFLTSLVWAAALFIYGISSKLLGEYGSSIGWLVFNAIALVVSSMWGIVTGEWKGAKKPLRLLYAGDVILLISWIFIMQV